MSRFNIVAKQLLWHLTLIIMAVILVLLVRAIDRAIPVVVDFKVISQTVTSNSIIISGSFNKVRDCQFLDLYAMTPDGHKLWINYLDKPTDRALETRPVRIQLWGPWEVFNRGSSSVAIYVHHACSVFWSQTTLLTNLTIVEVEALPAVELETTE